MLKRLNKELQTPARYLPFLSGKYTVKPGLSAQKSENIFLIDSLFSEYRNSKLEARKNLGRVFLRDDIDPEIEKQISKFICQTLKNEYPQYFEFDQNEHGSIFRSNLTSESAYFNFSNEFQKYIAINQDPGYSEDSPLDFLASQIQEDIAITSFSNGRDWLSALHVSHPSYWDPRDKIGKSFVEVHAPVPGAEKFNSSGLVKLMISGIPNKRYVWGISTNPKLNGHPERYHKEENSELNIIVERQTIIPFPDINSSLFLIHPYVHPINSLTKEEKLALVSAVKSMTLKQKAYKGISQDIILSIESQS